MSGNCSMVTHLKISPPNAPKLTRSGQPCWMAA